MEKKYAFYLAEDLVLTGKSDSPKKNFSSLKLPQPNTTLDLLGILFVANTIRGALLLRVKK